MDVLSIRGRSVRFAASSVLYITYLNFNGGVFKSILF